MERRPMRVDPNPNPRAAVLSVLLPFLSMGLALSSCAELDRYLDDRPPAAASKGKGLVFPAPGQVSIMDEERAGEEGVRKAEGKVPAASAEESRGEAETASPSPSPSSSSESKPPATPDPVEGRMLRVFGLRGPEDAVLVRRALLGVSGISSVQVDVVRGSVFLLGRRSVDMRKVREALGRLGFRAPDREE